MKNNNHKLINMKNSVLQVFFPKTCPICDKVLGYGKEICDTCAAKIHFIEEPRCKKCSKQLGNSEQEYCMDCSRSRHIYKKGIAAFAYDDVISKSIYRFKYYNRRTYAQYYGLAIAERYGSEIADWGADVIVPVPIHEKKRIKRGYNQAELIAAILGSRLGIKTDNSYLVRIANTKPQKEMEKAERKKNLEKAFKIVENVVEYKKIILVDDIYTTGSTIDECARTLIAGGTQEVYFVSLSIGAGI